jgi:acetyltransferase
VTAVDALEHEGLSPARLSDTTRTTLEEALPPGAGLENPVDMLASASPHDFGACLEILIDAPEVDAVLVVFAPPPMYPAADVAGSLAEIAGNSSKPVLVAVMGEHSIGPAVEQLRAGRIPDFRFPEPAAKSLAMLTARAEAVAMEPEPPIRPDGLGRNEAAAILRAAPAGWLTPAATTEVLEAYGIRAAPVDIAVGEDEAVRSAARFGGSVALKLVSAGLTHKSDVGGVRLGLASEREIRGAYSDLMAIAADLGERSAQVSIQPMVQGAHDLIVGAIRDGQFGPVLVFGSGGIETEGLGDIEFALAPLTERDVEFLLAGTWAGRRLSGYRSVPSGDVEAVKDVIRRVGWLLDDQPRVAEIEINPLRALTAAGAVALDVRMRIE